MNKARKAKHIADRAARPDRQSGNPFRNIAPDHRALVEELIWCRITRSWWVIAWMVFLIGVVGAATLGLAILANYCVSRLFGRLPETLVLLPLLPAFLVCGAIAWWSHQRVLVSSWLCRAHVQDELTSLGLCTGCGYDLSGNDSGVCPECGTEAGAPPIE